MKEYTIKSRKSHALRFWIVTMVCAAMIGTACWFAYRQTANELKVQLDTTVGSIPDMPATNPPYTKSTVMPMTTAASTERVTARTTTTAATAETVAVAAPPETAPSSETVTEATSLPPLQWPLAGEILQPYSNGELVKSPTTGVWQTHNGIDISGSLGDEVRAMSDGVVTLVEEDALWGVTVTIDHKNGFLSRYCNLNEGLNVCQGDMIDCETVIGAIGQTADSESKESPHLHFEVIRDGAYLNPELLLAEAD